MQSGERQVEAFLNAVVRSQAPDERVQSILAIFQQFAEFSHLASASVSEKACASFVPEVEMAKANPMRVAAVRADVDCARFGALIVAAFEFLHDLRFLKRVRLPEAMPFRQGFVLPHKEEVILLSPPLRTVADGTVLSAQQPVLHLVDEQVFANALSTIHS